MANKSNKWTFKFTLFLLKTGVYKTVRSGKIEEVLLLENIQVSLFSLFVSSVSYAAIVRYASNQFATDLEPGKIHPEVRDKPGRIFNGHGW